MQFILNNILIQINSFFSIQENLFNYKCFEFTSFNITLLNTIIYIKKNG
jgi:hypothetical protein